MMCPIIAKHTSSATMAGYKLTCCKDFCIFFNQAQKNILKSQVHNMAGDVSSHSF